MDCSSFEDVADIRDKDGCLLAELCVGDDLHPGLFLVSRGVAVANFSFADADDGVSAELHVIDAVEWLEFIWSFADARDVLPNDLERLTGLVGWIEDFATRHRNGLAEDDELVARFGDDPNGWLKNLRGWHIMERDFVPVASVVVVEDENGEPDAVVAVFEPAAWAACMWPTCAPWMPLSNDSAAREIVDSFRHRILGQYERSVR